MTTIETAYTMVKLNNQVRITISKYPKSLDDIKLATGAPRNRPKIPTENSLFEKISRTQHAALYHESCVCHACSGLVSWLGSSKGLPVACKMYR